MADKYAKYDDNTDMSVTVSRATIHAFQKDLFGVETVSGQISMSDEYPDSAYVSNYSPATSNSRNSEDTSGFRPPKDNDGEEFRQTRTSILSQGKSEHVSLDGAFDVELEAKNFPVRQSEIASRLKFYEYELDREIKIRDGYAKMERMGFIGSANNFARGGSSDNVALNKLYASNEGTRNRPHSDAETTDDILFGQIDFTSEGIDTADKSATIKSTEDKKKGSSQRAIAKSNPTAVAEGLRKSSSQMSLADRLLQKAFSAKRSPRTSQTQLQTEKPTLSLVEISNKRIQCLTEIVGLIKLHWNTLLRQSDIRLDYTTNPTDDLIRLDEVNKDLHKHTIRKRFENDYEILGTLGKGKGVDTYVGKQKLSPIYVVIKKFYVNGFVDTSEHMRCIEQQKRCFASPMSVKVYGNYFCNVDMTLTSVTEYCECGSLGDYLQNNSIAEGQISAIMSQLLKAISYLHAHEIVHKDIKANNILILKRGRLKLAEITPSSIFKPDRNVLDGETHLGFRYNASTFWTAPEVFARGAIYSLKADIWSVGITLIEIAETYPPLAVDTLPVDAIKKILENPSPTLRHGSIWSNQMNDFIAKCLTKDPKKRPSCQDIQTHPFITGASSTDCLFSISETMEQSHSIIKIAAPTSNSSLQ